MKVENNNVFIWKGGKSITVNVDLVRIYHLRERDEGVVETDGFDGERSRAEQVESEGSKGLASEESSKEGHWRGRRVISKGSTESSNNKEKRHQSKRRPPVRKKWRKRSEPSSMVENTEMERRSHGSCKWRERPIQVTLPSGTRKMTRRKAAYENQVLSGRSSPGPPRGAADNERQVLPGRSSPYPLRNRLRFSERQAATGRISPYLTRAGRVETAMSRSIFRPYK
ncbi:hypothetical protein NPIL_439051 [Nephila pilipes]|uniref:Uncharacterized protein n=1 Tax=Nephila pilipes TaxID=299642 RepID=A0A8X6UK50_NEPPI|nr:hypothetical protein NPIL_400641 [Nephila pilipes]GFU18546.1 hypothetical protein NPIL_439051 [Nephila pilipes]